MSAWWRVTLSRVRWRSWKTIGFFLVKNASVDDVALP
jgi:hypothetical protein